MSPNKLVTLALLLGLVPNHTEKHCPCQHCRCRCHLYRLSQIDTITRKQKNPQRTEPHSPTRTTHRRNNSDERKRIDNDYYATSPTRRARPQDQQPVLTVRDRPAEQIPTTETKKSQEPLVRTTTPLRNSRAREEPVTTTKTRKSNLRQESGKSLSKQEQILNWTTRLPEPENIEQNP